MRKILLFAFLAIAIAGCKKDKPADTEPEFFVNEDPATFAQTGSIDIGETGAAEISASIP